MIAVVCRRIERLESKVCTYCAAALLRYAIDHHFIKRGRAEFAQAAGRIPF